MIKLKRFKFTTRYCQEIEPGSMLITAESLESASYRILKSLGFHIEEISDKEFFASGGKDNGRPWWWDLNRREKK